MSKESQFGEKSQTNENKEVKQPESISFFGQS